MEKHYYQQRINKAVDYLNKNLQDDIKMEELAQISLFSAFHFQRIYKGLQGETPYETLMRLRLEKAIFLLKYEDDLKLTDIAFDSGFPTYENFSRQFKARYQRTPSAFRKDVEKHKSKIYQEDATKLPYICNKESEKGILKNFLVEIEDLEEIPIAFIRAIFGADGTGLVERYQELIQWAEKYNIPYQGALTRFGMSIDNPAVTPKDKYRYDFAVKLDPTANYELEGLVELGSIPKSKYATVHCQGKIEDVGAVWDYLYQEWLAQSGFRPRHFPAIEEFIQGPEEIGWLDFNIKCRIPILKI